MKIDLVHPAHYDEAGRLVQAKGWVDRLGAYLPHLGPPLIAALTPEGHDVRVVEEYLEDVDLDAGADLVAISAQVMQFDRARDLAAAYRERGVRTVLGGYLPTMLPERVEGLFDAIVVGEGDEVWPRLVADAERGELQTRYDAPGPAAVEGLPVPRYDLIRKDRVVVYPVQATRGCPYLCRYCSIAAVHRGGYRRRPVDEVVRDVEATGSRWINFCDDNLCEDARYAGRLFDALAGAPIRWGTQTTIRVADSPELLQKAKASGCSLMALGVETLSARNLDELDKAFQKVDRYAEGFRRMMDAGISPHALIIFGLPDDGPETFARAVDYLSSLDVPVAQFFLMTPYPGTPEGDRLHEDGRVFDTELAHLREPYVVFEHERLSGEELRAGWWGALESFYSLRSIARRILFSRRAPNRIVDLATNLYYWSKVKRGIHTVYFG